ncbi:pth11-like integral membrane [Ceratocystis lukuohia]|uniref:Pth11-like integral membrane n=1 Tax=Ceratocystis lukuohia TaxID=2019550 RepID=A0ABR4MDL2_9PEZI
MAIDKLTLGLHWAFTWLTVIIITTRLIWRKILRQPYLLGDWLSIAALLCVLARLGLIHVVLIWGTSNIPAALRAKLKFTPDEIYRREIGSKLSLANRPCVAAQVQLVVVGVTNIVTDFMLLLLPIPLLIGLQANARLKLQLSVLFTLGIFIIAITVIRLPINSLNQSLQSSRTTWASTELFTSAVVVNAPTLYGFWNKRRQASKNASSNPTGGRTGGSTVGTAVGSYSASGTRRGPRRPGSQIDYMANIEGDIYDDSYEMGARRPPLGGIMQTKEVRVSELSAVEAKTKGYNHLDDGASSHSSQKQMIQEETSAKGCVQTALRFLACFTFLASKLLTAGKGPLPDTKQEELGLQKDHDSSSSEEEKRSSLTWNHLSRDKK